MADVFPPQLLTSARQVLMGLLEPFLYLSEPAERLFWPFLASAGLLAGLCYSRDRRDRPRSPRDFLRWLAPAGFAKHASTRLDLKLLFFKALVHALVLAPLLMPLAVTIAATSTTLRWAFGPVAPPDWPHWVVTATFTCVAFVAEDWSRYFFHRLTHRVPVLWAIHKVHHSAEVLSPLTVYRTHPFESILYRIRELVTLGAVTGAFMYGFGNKLGGWDILGVDALGFVFNLAGANLRHSHVWLSFGPRIERWFISPAQHQLHHSQALEHHDRNFGAFLSVWDRLGGTLILAGKRSTLKLGLDSASRNHDQSLASALVSPLREVGALLTRKPKPKARTQSAASTPQH